MIVSTLVMVLLLAGAAAAVVVQPWHVVRDPEEGAETPSTISGAPSAPDQANSAQCADAPPTTTAELTDISDGRHETFDRIVLRVDGPEPECVAAYVDQIVADGSGIPIPLAGSSFLRVTLRGAAAHDGAGRPTFNGPSNLDTPNLENITAVALAGDFEGHVTVGLGMRVRTRYQVFALSGPTRVVIDVEHA